MAETTHTTNDSLTFSITSLVTGILSTLTGVFFILSVPLGAVAVVFAALGLRKTTGKGLAIAGLITGIVGLATGLFIVILALIGSTHGSMYTY